MRSLILIASLTFCATLQAQVAVVNGASFRKDQPVAPGSLASAFGTFTGVMATSASSLPLPATLAGVSVTVEGVTAPLLYVSDSQINFVVPSQSAAGMRVIEVKTAAGAKNGTFWVTQSAPGIFKKDSATPAKGAILNQDSSENSASIPAQRGQVISIYATGPGALNSAVQDGTGAPQSPLAMTAITPRVYIGGVETTVQFSGLAPGFASLWQVNAYVPQQSFISGKIPVQVFMNGVDSNEVTVFVSQ
jgi:uncharacterized protein (TIGR03437 family)